MRRLLLLLLAGLLVLATAGCGNDSGRAQAKAEDSINGLKVSGSFGSAPKVTVKPAVKVTSAQSEVITKGSGDTVRPGAKALLGMYVARGSDGTKAVSTYDEGKPLSTTLDDSRFFPPLVKVLTGATTGSRIAFADTVKDLYGAAGASQIGMKASDTLVFVVDVLSTNPTTVLKGPKGEHLKAPPGTPSIVSKHGTITRLDFKGVDKPDGKLHVIPLVKGTGEKIEGPKIVTMNYLGQVFGSTKPFNDSYGQGPVPFDVGVGGLIPAWDKALRGQRLGSRLMLVVPPKYGYGPQGNPDIKVTGKSTMVFLIDILGVG